MNLEPLDKEALRKHYEGLLARFAPRSGEGTSVADADSVMAIAIERANAAGLPEVAGLLVHVARDRHAWRVKAKAAQKLAAFLYQVLRGKREVSELSEAEMERLDDSLEEE